MVAAAELLAAYVGLTYVAVRNFVARCLSSLRLQTGQPKVLWEGFVGIRSERLDETVA